MGILDNLEAYLEARYNIDENDNEQEKCDDSIEKCHYCTNKAKYTDVAEIAKQGYAVIGVCQCHFVQDVS
jgi:hypothetical protein